jgi:hypothetical protein
VKWGAASRGLRGSGRLSPVEAVGGVAWTNSGMEEGFRRTGTGSTSSLECRGALGLMVACSQKKVWPGRSRGTEEEERRGRWGSGAGGATWRMEEGRPGFGRATWRRTVRGGLAPVGARGRRGQAAVVQRARGRG